MDNARPVAINDVLTFSEDDDYISANLLENDIYAESQGFLRFFDGVRVDAKESLYQPTIVAGDFGTFTVRPDGRFVYELDQSLTAVQNLEPGETLVERLTYKISDGMGETDVATLELTIAGSPTKTVHIDFEDLATGSTIPDGYKGFDWGDGWVVATDDVGEMSVGNQVVQPLQSTDTIRLVDGADFGVVEIVLNNETEHNVTTVVGFNDGVAIHSAEWTTGIEPSLMDLQWDGIDALQITHDPGSWIDTMTVVVPAV
jgi:autoaggregation protein RapA/B/C